MNEINHLIATLSSKQAELESQLSKITTTLELLRENQPVPKPIKYRERGYTRVIKQYSDATVRKVRRLYATQKYTAQQISDLTGVEYTYVRQLYLNISRKDVV